MRKGDLRATCKKGHAMEEPNLIHKTVKGREVRECRMCANAGFRRRRKEKNEEAVSKIDNALQWPRCMIGDGMFTPEEARLLRRLIEVQERSLKVLERIACRLPSTANRVLGGVMTQIGDPVLPIAVGNSPQYQVTPTWATPPAAGETTLLAQASIASSDPTDFPVALNSTDPTGTTFTLGPIPPQDTIGEGDTITWEYTNTDGTTASVVGTVTIVNGVPVITDDVTGGTFTQIA